MKPYFMMNLIIHIIFDIIDTGILYNLVNRLRWFNLDKGSITVFGTEGV